ncbi:Zinc knuckle [Popillia japonica]|uniref:Zinc knuckle n=1 Tax=Popillia japonica TaxID=7064 RepID=A0AAW1HVT8_POPJA
MGKFVCYTCKKEGHVITNCPSVTKENLAIENVTIDVDQNAKYFKETRLMGIWNYVGFVTRADTIIEQCQVGTKASEDNIDDLKKLIGDYSDCFALNLSELGRARDFEMHMELVTNKIVTHRPYGLAYSERVRVQKQIDELKKAGIVEESISDFASPIVVVKKTGEERICV